MSDSIFRQIGNIVGTAVSELSTRIDNIEITNNLGISIIDGDGVIASSIIPESNITYDLGSPTKMWRDIYVGPGSLYVNGQKVLQDDSGTITVSADLNQNVQIKTSGSGDIEFYPSGTGVLQMKGTVSLLSGTNLTTSDGQPISCPVGFSDLTIQNLTVSGTTTTVNTENVTLADNILTLNSNVIGTPTENAGIEVERGDENNAKILYNETLNVWQFTNDGSTYITMGDVSDHTHIISDIDSLQTSLDGKVDASQVLTNVPAGAIFTDTTYSNISEFTNDSGYITDYTVTESDVTTHQASLSITTSQISDFGSYEPADSTILKDADIGINIQGYDVNIVSDENYNHISVTTTSVSDGINTFDKYTHPATHSIAEVSELQTALDGKLTSTGNAVSASKLETARTISLTGDVSGSASFDGSGNISINTTVSGGGGLIH